MERIPVEDGPMYLSDQPVYYEIRLKAALSAHWSDWFGEMRVTMDNAGQTVLAGWIPDQAALFGVLTRIRDLGIVLISVSRIDNTEVHSTPGHSRRETK
jgi:hypothetical protein